MSREQVARFLRHVGWGLAGSGPYSDSAPGPRDVLRHDEAAAAAYDYCAERMQRWADLTVARGGKPDWTEFHVILDGWRLGARSLRGEQ